MLLDVKSAGARTMSYSSFYSLLLILLLSKYLLKEEKRKKNEFRAFAIQKAQRWGSVGRIIWISRAWVIQERNKLLYLPTNFFIPASFQRGLRWFIKIHI